jgi:hypothetical protein
VPGRVDVESEPNDGCRLVQAFLILGESRARTSGFLSLRDRDVLKNRLFGTRFDDYNFGTPPHALSVTCWIFEMSVQAFLKYMCFVQ